MNLKVAYHEKLYEKLKKIKMDYNITKNANFKNVFNQNVKYRSNASNLAQYQNVSSLGIRMF